MVAGPGSVLVLHFDDFVFHAAVPLLSLRTPGAAEAVADVQVREEFLAADRTVPGYETSVGKLPLDGIDFLLVFPAIPVRPAELFQRLRFLIERYAGRSSRSSRR